MTGVRDVPIGRKAAFVKASERIYRKRWQALLTIHLDFSSAACAAVASAPVTACTMRTARSRSFRLEAFKSTIKLLTTLPMRTIASVVIVLRMILVAVPDLRRVEPVKTSGPTSGAMTTAGRIGLG